MVDGLRPDSSYSFRVVAKSPSGDAVASAWQTLETKPAPPAKGTGKGRVALSLGNPVEETTPWSGARPVTSGIPFPKGAVGSDQHLRLLDASGQELPLQSRTLGRWNDGSVKWALLDFQKTSGETYTVEYGTEVNRQKLPSALQVTDGRDSVTIVTGPLRRSLTNDDLNSRGQCGSMRTATERSKTGKTSAQGLPTSKTLAAALYEPRAAGRVVVEESGPVRAVVRLTGPHVAADGRKLFAYVVRLHFYAQPYPRHNTHF
jgi:hypothetical protein